MGEEKHLNSPTEGIDPEGADFDRLDHEAQIARLLVSQQRAIDAVSALQPSLARAAKDMISTLQQGTGRLIYAGAGCSIRIGVQDGVELVPTFGWPLARLAYLIAGGPQALSVSVEGAEDDRADAIAQVGDLAVNAHDVVIGVAASGNTAFTCAALNQAKALGALTVAVSSNPTGALLQFADHALQTDTGAEVLAGSTRLAAGTAQKIVLNVLSTTVMTGLGRVLGNEMLCVQATNAKLKDRQVRILRRQVSSLDAESAVELLQSTAWDLRCALLIAHGWAPDAALDALQSDVPFRDLLR